MIFWPTTYPHQTTRRFSSQQSRINYAKIHYLMVHLSRKNNKESDGGTRSDLALLFLTKTKLDHHWRNTNSELRWDNSVFRSETCFHNKKTTRFNCFIRVLLALLEQHLPKKVIKTFLLPRTLATFNWNKCQELTLMIVDTWVLSYAREVLWSLENK